MQHLIMDFIRFPLAIFFSTISRLKGDPPPSPQTPKRNELLELPVELLLSVADFLDRDDITCMSLCNRQLFAIFHRRNDSELRAGHEKPRLLARIARDMPSWFVCYNCNFLHRYHDSKDFLPGPSRQISLRCLKASTHFDLPHALIWERGSEFYQFHFLHLQLLMRAITHGSEYGISTDEISRTQVQLCNSPYGLHVPLLSSVDARISPGYPGLILKVQHIVLVPCNKRRLLYRCPNPESTKLAMPQYSMVICEHAERYGCQTLSNTPLQAHLAGQRDPSVSWTCGYCDTEVVIEIRQINGEVALIMTKWIGLGEGMTPDDHHWQKHRLWGRGIITVKRGKDTANVMSPRARSCFDGDSEDQLWSRNIDYLKDQNYKKLMIHQADCGLDTMWYLRRKSH